MRHCPSPAWVLVGLLAGCYVPFSLITSDANLQDKSSFSPTQTGFAVLDDHVTVDAGMGAQEIRQRPEARVIVFLSGTRFDPEVDLASMPARDLEDLIRQVRRSDLVLIENLPASAVRPNTSLNASIPNGPTDQFTFVLQRANVGFKRNLTFAETPIVEFGSRQSVTAQAVSVDLREYGRLDLNPITLTLARGSTQPDSAPVSTGSVTIHAVVPIISERLGMSNLALLRQAVREP